MRSESFPAESFSAPSPLAGEGWGEGKVPVFKSS